MIGIGYIPLVPFQGLMKFLNENEIRLNFLASQEKLVDKWKSILYLKTKYDISNGG